MTDLPEGTRDRIVSAAAELFYEEGVKSVSVDAVAAKAGVTKRTLYYHFASKDDLIAAYLDGRDQPSLMLFKRWFARQDGEVADKVQAIFTNLARTARRPSWKGCGFLRTTVELASLPGHPAVQIARRHKKAVEGWLENEFAAASMQDAAMLARAIMLLLEGAFAMVMLHRDPAYMEAAGESAAALVRSATSG